MKCWILEGFVTREKMIENIEMIKGLEAKDDVQREAKEQVLDANIKRLEENPNGYWLGYQGKTRYYQFCDCAKETLRNMKDKMTFRVVEAEIDDKSKTWIGYKVIKENPGVMKFLMATLYR